MSLKPGAWRRLSVWSDECAKLKLIFFGKKVFSLVPSPSLCFFAFAKLRFARLIAKTWLGIKEVISKKN
jgi:hypothetical protein